MNELILVLSLAAGAPAAPPCCLYPAPQFALAADRAKERRDNVIHFVAPAALTFSLYGAALHVGASRTQARWLAVGTSVVLIVAKEFYDRSVAGRFGLEETAIGIGGVASGLLVAEKVVWPQTRVAR